MVITRLIAEEDEAWQDRMDTEVRDAKNTLAHMAVLRSRTALAEMTMVQTDTINKS